MTEVDTYTTRYGQPVAFKAAALRIMRADVERIQAVSGGSKGDISHEKNDRSLEELHGEKCEDEIELKPTRLGIDEWGGR